MSAFKAKKIKKEEEIYLVELLEGKPLSEDLKVVFLTLTGSRLYGTQYEKGENPLDENYISDFDYRGVFMGNPYRYLRYNSDIKDTAQVLNEEDEEYYELLKFIRMAADNNPNIMDILFAPDDAIIYESPIFRLIRDNRERFLTERVKDKFVGYANGQLSRLQSHRKFLVQYPEVHDIEEKLRKAHENKDIDFNWISHRFSGGLAKRITGLKDSDNKPMHSNIDTDEFIEKYGIDYDLKKYLRPNIKDYMIVKNTEMVDLSENESLKILEKIKKAGTYKVVSGDLIELRKGGRGIIAADGGLIKNPSDGAEPFAYAKINSGDYKSAKKANADLWSWHVGRNEKRAKLERVYGYDTKHAMHLFRLLLNAKELILTGTYNPRLSGKNLEMVKDIREGRMLYKDVVEKSKSLKNELDKIIKSGMHKIKNKRVDVDFVNSIIEQSYRMKEEEDLKLNHSNRLNRKNKRV